MSGEQKSKRCSWLLSLMFICVAVASVSQTGWAISKADKICNDTFADLLAGNGKVAGLIDRIEKAVQAAGSTPQELADVRLRYHDLLGSYPEDAKVEMSRIIRAIERSPEIVGAKSPQEAQGMVRKALENNGGACAL